MTCDHSVKPCSTLTNRPSLTAAIDLDNDDDPVVSEYDVFITPELEHQLYVLQYINRPPDLPFTKTTQSQPSEIRIKPQSGFIEVDIPINIRQNYNKPQGVRWGEALRKTKGFGQKAYGTAAGFERVMPRLNTRPGADAPAANTVDNDDNIEEYITNFEDANEKGHVLNTQTFGGQIMKDEGSAPSYMVGTFRNGTYII
jgi:DNA-directed RNA polymerase-3 subunit RPC5